MREVSLLEFLELLQPPPPTPPDEICQCGGGKPVKLMCALTSNPIRCIDCNLEIEPSLLPLTESVTRGIAYWRHLYDAIDRLWLDSREYEAWARSQLSDINSPINRTGLEARAALDPLRRCYYWLFQDESVEDFQPITQFPICGAAFLQEFDASWPQSRCETCSIVTVIHFLRMGKPRGYFS